MRPSSLAFASKPCFILTKNGLVLVLVISPTIGPSANEGALESAIASAATAAVENMDSFLDMGSSRIS